MQSLPVREVIMYSEEDELSIDTNIKKPLLVKEITTESSVQGNAEELLSTSDFLELLQSIESGKVIHNCVSHEHIMVPTISMSEHVINHSEQYGHKCWKFDFRRCEKNGGLIYLNEKLMKEQKRVLLNVIKRIGSNILHGRSIMNISMPVEIFEGRSFLQRIARGFGYAPQLLRRAASSHDVLEQLKLCMTLIVSKFCMSFMLGIHLPCFSSTPLCYCCRISPTNARSLPQPTSLR